MTEPQTLSDEEIKTSFGGGAAGAVLEADPDGTDPDTKDADGTDSDSGSDADGTDSGSGSDADGTDTTDS